MPECVLVAKNGNFALEHTVQLADDMQTILNLDSSFKTFISESAVHLGGWSQPVNDGTLMLPVSVREGNGSGRSVFVCASSPYDVAYATVMDYAGSHSKPRADVAWFEPSFVLGAWVERELIACEDELIGYEGVNLAGKMLELLSGPRTPWDRLAYTPVPMFTDGELDVNRLLMGWQMVSPAGDSIYITKDGFFPDRPDAVAFVPQPRAARPALLC